MPSAKARKEYDRLRAQARRDAEDYVVNGNRHLDNVNLSNLCQLDLNDNLVRDLMALYRQDERTTEAGIRNEVRFGIVSEDDDDVLVKRHILKTMKNTVNGIRDDWKKWKREFDTPIDQLADPKLLKAFRDFAGSKGLDIDGNHLGEAVMPKHIRVNGVLYEAVVNESKEDPGADKSRIIKLGRYIADTDYLDLDDIENNAVVNDSIIVDGDGELGDTEDILAVAISLSQRQGDRIGGCYQIADEMDPDELENVLDGEHLDNLFYLDCSTYGGENVAVDPFAAEVEPIRDVPAALKALQRYADESGVVDEGLFNRRGSKKQSKGSRASGGSKIQSGTVKIADVKKWAKQARSYRDFEKSFSRVINSIIVPFEDVSSRGAKSFGAALCETPSHGTAIIVVLNPTEFGGQVTNMWAVYNFYDKNDRVVFNDVAKCRTEAELQRVIKKYDFNNYRPF